MLTAIRENDVIIGSQAATDQLEAIAVMLQGVVFSSIALNYDQGFVVTEATDLSNPLALPLERLRLPLEQANTLAPLRFEARASE